MATFAQYPELPDEDKEQPDSDISNQQKSTIGTPAGQSVAASKPQAPQNSSGLNQNFSAFRDANKSKLEALQNVALGNAQKSVDDSKSAFNNQVGSETAALGANQKTFENSNISKLGLNSDLSNIGKEYAVTNADANPGVANLSSGQQYQDFKAAQDRAANLNTKAGTTDNLVQNGTNAANAAQDSLLLQTNANYRRAAQDLATRNAGVAENALTQATGALTNKAKLVNDKNQEYQKSARDALNNLAKGIDGDLSSRATTQEQARQAGISAETAKLNEALRARALRDADLSGLVAPKETLDNYSLDYYIKNGDKNVNYAAEKAAYDAKVAEANAIKAMTNDQLLARYGGTNLLNAAQGGSITASNVLNQDAQRQAQISALQRLLGGDYEGAQYNQGAIAPKTDFSALENLIASLTKTTPATAAAQPAPVAAPAATPRTGSAGSGGYSKTPLIRK